MNTIQPLKLAALLSACLLAACSAKVDTRGYVSTGDIKTMVSVGQTRDEVLTNLGSPSSQSSFGNETWYYISSRKEATAFLKPEVVKQDVTKIEFDTAGMVSKVETFNEENSQDIAIAKRKTPTEGHSLGFMEQLLGNVGRFNKPADNSGPGSR
jgi:outer membrane protein assembly factor BamE (lipoprotein component of BamABCDE complex)